jgi:hypothetical protein
MRLEVTRNVERPIALHDVDPVTLKGRVLELAGLVDEVAGVLREMGAAEESIHVTLATGWRYGYVKGTGDRPDEKGVGGDGLDRHGGTST